MRLLLLSFWAARAVDAYRWLEKSDAFNRLKQRTEKCLRTILLKEGYKLSPERQFGETGVDVIAHRDNDSFHIEVIGYKSSGPARAKDFYESFFRVISRLKDGASKCVIAMPINAKIGLPARANQYGIAWNRIGLAFPELEIWLVDIGKMAIEKSVWLKWGRPTTA